MNEIRFNPPVRADDPSPKEEKISDKKKSIFKFLKNLLKLLVVLVFLSIVGVAVKTYFPKVFNKISNGGDTYSAVFLGNGQVYFGKMTKNSDKEIVLNNVYYLQVGEGADSLNQSSFKLVKLGDELHGPTDELFINKASVIFYEYLRDDSKVVESIKGS